MAEINWGRVWATLAGGSGAAGILGGKGIAYLDLWNMGNFTAPDIHVIVELTRAGLWAGGSASQALAIAAGVSTAQELDGLKSSGLDWQLDIGVKAGDAIKTGSKLAQLFLKVVMAVGKNAKKDALKNLVQSIMQGFGWDGNKRSWFFLTTPLGAGLGAGVFYEWQTIYSIGGRKAWDLKPPKWRMVNSGGEAILEMEDIPEPSLFSVGITFLERTRLWWDKPFEMGSHRYGWSNNNYFRALCYNGRLMSKPEDNSSPNMEDLLPGIREYNEWGFKDRYDQEVYLALRVTEHLTEHHVPLWESKEYCRVKTDKNGRLVQAVTTGWLG